MSDEPAVQAEHLTKRFGSTRALDGLDLVVPAGTMLGLLGPNGAGKTTAVRILTTQLAPDGGRARVLGHDIVRDAAGVRRVVGLSGQFAAVDGYLTVRENLHMVGRLSGLTRRSAAARVDQLLAAFDLTPAAHHRARDLSGGTRRRLDVAAALVARPPVLFLDEPTTGLDPASRARLWDLLRDLVAGGTTVVLTTQYLEEADRLADRIVVVDHGHVVAEGTPDGLRRQVGGERLDIRAAPGTDVHRLAAAVAGLGAGVPDVDPVGGRVLVPVTTGPEILADVAARLSSGSVQVAEVALRKPTLDDVFLALTDHAALGSDHDHA